MMIPRADDGEFLQFFSGFSHALAANAKHVGDQLLGHGQFVARQAIQRKQDPTGELLGDAVVAVADRSLRHLQNQGLDITQQQLPQLTVTVIEFSLEWLGTHAQGIACALDEHAARRTVAAENHGDADDAVIADDRNLRRVSVLRRINPGYDAVAGEVDPLDRIARLIQTFSSGSDMPSRWGASSP